LFRTDIEGQIPALLTKWYAERKELQKLQAEWEAKLEHADDSDKADIKQQILFYNQRQYAKKIILNSLYGALLNNVMRFFDQRVGQSTTLSGRMIVRHMIATINKLITGEYDYKGAAIEYGDTDSCFFSAYEVLKDHPDYQDEWSRDNIIEMYKMITDEVNLTFPSFMQETFNTSEKRGAYIKAGLDLVGSRALFIKKKKYAIMNYYFDGNRYDVDNKPGKLKVMGLDLKRSDTPRFMQQFLEKLLMDVLADKPKADIYQSILEFRIAFKSRPGWEKGAPKKVSNLSAFASKRATANKLGLTEKMKRGEKLKVNTPGHVLASLNWNMLCDLFEDRHAMRITDSARIIVCKLLNNNYGMTSIAYPIDETHLPQWFRELPFDHAEMEEKIIDNKLDNLLGVLEWDLTDTKEKAGDEFFHFGNA
jgi:DNA polymerase elongation subunit (family B)